MSGHVSKKQRKPNYKYLFQTKKSKERKKQPSREDVTEEPAIRPDQKESTRDTSQHEFQKSGCQKEETVSEEQKEVNTIQFKETAHENDSNIHADTEKTEVIENLDTGQRKAEVEESSVERAVTDQTITEKNDSLSCEETFFSFKDESKETVGTEKVVQAENVVETDIYKDKVVTDIKSGATIDTAVIKTSEPESKEEYFKTESYDLKGVYKVPSLEKVNTETKETEVLPETLQAESGDIVREERETKNECVTTREPKLLEDLEKIKTEGVAQKQLYPDLTRDIEQYRAELEQVSVVHIV